MKIDDKTLGSLHTYFQKDGSTKRADIAKFLKIDEALTQPFIDALKINQPDIYGVFDGKAPTEVSKVLLVDSATGIGEQLEIKSQKDGRIVVERIVPPEPTDLVTVKIGGKDVEIDLHQLRKMDRTTAMLGTSVGSLIVIGELAKGA